MKIAFPDRNLSIGSQSVFNVCDRGFTINKAEPKRDLQKREKENNLFTTRKEMDTFSHRTTTQIICAKLMISSSGV